MHLYTVNAEETIFHTISILANSESEAMKSVNEIIKDKRTFSTSQQIEITRVKEIS
jgi:hypothetical protein